MTQAQKFRQLKPKLNGYAVWQKRLLITEWSVVLFG